MTSVIKTAAVAATIMLAACGGGDAVTPGIPAINLCNGILIQPGEPNPCLYDDNGMPTDPIGIWNTTTDPVLQRVAVFPRAVGGNLF